MLDYRPSRRKRTALILGGSALAVLSAFAWTTVPSPENALFFGAGMVTGWWMISRSRSRLVLFQHQGLYWDGFRHTLLHREQCSVTREGSETLIRTSQANDSPTLSITHLGNVARQGVIQWCDPTSVDETAGQPAQGVR